MIKEFLSRKYHIEKECIGNPERYGSILLHQVGRSHCTKDYVVGEHIHRTWFELTHVIEGKGYAITNGVSVPISTGDIYFSFPGDVHALYTSKDELMKFHFISFRPENEEHLKTLGDIMLFNVDPEKRIFSDKNVEYHISNCLSEAFRNDPQANKILACSLEQIIYYIERNFASGTKDKKLSVDSSQELCYQLMNYINTHIYDISNLETLSAYFGYSYSYLSGIFRKTTGETLKSFHTARRLDVASRLLREGQLSTSKIAETLNYSSVYAFSRAFKTRFGISPTAFKADNQ